MNGILLKILTNESILKTSYQYTSEQFVDSSPSSVDLFKYGVPSVYVFYKSSYLAIGMYDGDFLTNVETGLGYLSLSGENMTITSSGRVSGFAKGWAMHFA